MDKIAKALKKLSIKERLRLKIILQKIELGDYKNLDIKKLKGRNDIFRARQRTIRIVFRVDKLKRIFILLVERRSNTTYKKF